jgi:hypothetical protein
MVRNQKAIFMMVVVLVVPSTENASLLPVQNVLIIYNQNELRGGYISAAYFKNKHDDNAALY